MKASLKIESFIVPGIFDAPLGKKRLLLTTSYGIYEPLHYSMFSVSVGHLFTRLTRLYVEQVGRKETLYETRHHSLASLCIYWEQQPGRLTENGSMSTEHFPPNWEVLCSAWLERWFKEYNFASVSCLIEIAIERKPEKFIKSHVLRETMDAASLSIQWRFPSYSSYKIK